MPTPIQMLYLVLGRSGSYDFASQWVVAALLSLDEASDYCKLATQASRDAVNEYRAANGRKAQEGCYFSAPTTYDLVHEVNGTDVRYTVEPVPFLQGAIPAQGLLGAVDGYATAQGQARERNVPGASQRFGLPPPGLPVSERSAALLAREPASKTSGH